MPSARNRAAAALGACLILSGCADYLANLDHRPLPGDLDLAEFMAVLRRRLPADAVITSGAGNFTDIDGDGRAVARAQQQYVAGRTADLTPAQPIFLTTTGDATTTD